MELSKRVEEALARATGEPAAIASTRQVQGGCINDSCRLQLADGREFFLKTHYDPPADLFASEALALERLAAPGVIEVPRPIAHDKDFLVLEWIPMGVAGRDWQEQMGRRLALLHQATRHERFGFETDNYLGTTPQPNGWRDAWAGFWRDRRLGWQLTLFAEKTGKDDDLLVLGRKLLGKVADILGGVNETAVLLHGDLWAGNAAANARGEPVIFDPASYYGHREAELGMMRLFGGFGPVCEAAYQEVWPLEDGSEERILLYRLYHELNHLNLFGGGYYQGCLTTIRALL